MWVGSRRLRFSASNRPDQRRGPDLVVITGDFVCHSQLYLDQLIELVREFRAPVIGVLGNHDHWAGADEVAAALSGWRGGAAQRQHESSPSAGSACRSSASTTRIPARSIDKAVVGLRRIFLRLRCPISRGSRPSLEVRYPAGASRTHPWRPDNRGASPRDCSGQIAATSTCTAFTARGSRIEARW